MATRAARRHDAPQGCREFVCFLAVVVVGMAVPNAEAATRVVKLALRRYYSLLSMAWGLASDSDIEADDCRCCGPLRFTLQARGSLGGGRPESYGR